MKIREAVKIKTHTAEMNRDNEYDPQPYKTTLYSDTPRASGGGGGSERLTSPPLKKASDVRKLGKSYNIQSQLS